MTESTTTNIINGTTIHHRRNVSKRMLRTWLIATGASLAVLPALASGGTAEAAVPSTNVFPIANSGAACADNFGVDRGDHLHAGVDCFSPAGLGTPLVAVESGRIDVVWYASPTNPCQQGNAVSVRGASGTRYYYGHLNTIEVRDEQPVTRGQRIGTLGQTGNANPSCGGGGPHLHFELRPDGTNVVDPYPYVSRWPKVGGGTSTGDYYQPFGKFDHLDARGGGSIGLWGWAADPDTKTKAIPVHVHVWGSNGVKKIYIFNANQYRSDVGSAYPGYGNYHGYSAVISGLPRGTAKVQVFAIDSSGKANDYKDLGAKWINVT